MVVTIFTENITVQTGGTKIEEGSIRTALESRSFFLHTRSMYVPVERGVFQ